jgi:Arc/MetJ-type ribon-helix-helix transcriptional regulator
VSVLPATLAPFPNDDPTEVIRAAIREMRRELAHIAAALDAVEADLSPPVEDDDHW